MFVFVIEMLILSVPEKQERSRNLPNIFVVKDCSALTYLFTTSSLPQLFL